MQKADIIVPSTMIAYKCGQSGRCCGGWAIGLDKSSYDRLKKVMTLNNHSKTFKKTVRKRKDNDLRGYHSFIKFVDGKCGFLESSGLCSIHKNYGIEALPDICKVFPRLVYITPFGTELSITFSCPAAAELLKNKEKIIKVKNPSNFNFYYGKLTYGKITNEIYDRTDIKKFYFELEDHFIEIMQSRIFSVDERLILLGITIKRLEALKEPNLINVNDIIKLTKSILSKAFFKEEVRKIEPVLKNQVFLLKEFVNLRIPALDNEELIKIFKMISSTFYFNENDDKLNLSINKYLECYYKTYYPVRLDFEHVIENYLVYYILRKPFAIYTLQDGFFLAIYFYSLIRLIAIGLAIEDNSMVNENILVKACWTVEKAIGHSYEFYNNILDFLRDNKLSSVSHAITLLKMPELKNSSASYVINNAV